LSGGKPDFAPGCLLEANIDSVLGCVTEFIPMTSEAGFDGDIFTGFYESMPAGCLICYAARNQLLYPKKFVVIDKKQLMDELHGNFKLFNSKKYFDYVGSLGTMTPDGKTYTDEERIFIHRGIDSTVRKMFEEYYGAPVKFIRFGKRTEVGATYNRPQLTTILEACKETGARPIFPTRFLEFSKELVPLLKATKTQLLSSLGYDELEPWIRFYGFDNNWRMEQARKYREAGVNANIYLTIEATNAPTEENMRVISFGQRHNIPIQLLPVRINTEEVAQAITGQSKRSLLQSVDQTTYELIGNKVIGGYERYGNSTISPLYIHGSWLKMVDGSNGFIRLCHHNSETLWCGGCFQLPKGFEKPMPEVILARIKKKPRRKKRRNDTLELEFDSKEISEVS
jgi:hypothetical protein